MRTAKKKSVTEAELALGMTINNLMSALSTALGDDPDNDGDEDYPWVVDANTIGANEMAIDRLTRPNGRVWIETPSCPWQARLRLRISF